MARLILIAGFCLALPGMALAQAVDETRGEGDEIVVTGTALPPPPAMPAYSSKTFSLQQLGSSASGRIEEVLSAAAGLQQFRRSDSRSANPSAQGVTLRALGGNASSRSLVLLDGVPMGDPFFGFVPLSALAPERLGAVRVTRGGGGGAFGSGAVAGTIELESAGPGELGRLSAQTLIDDRGETSLSGSLAPRLGSGFGVVSARWDRGQGFWTTPLAQRVAASVPAAYDGWSLALRGVVPLGEDSELQARALAYGDKRTLRFAGADSTSDGQDASLRLIGRGRWQFDVLAYLQARDFSNKVISATSFRKTLDQRATPSIGWGGKAELRPVLGAGHVLRLGADWRIADGMMFEDAYSALSGAITARRKAGGRNTDLGLFAEDDWRLGALVLTGGIRADRWISSRGFFRETNAAGSVISDQQFGARQGWNWSGRGGAVLGLGPGLDLRGSLYSGMRQPTLNELYRPFTVFPVTTRANAALLNEQLMGFEAGFDWRPAPGIELSATAFDNRLRRAIANVTIGPNLRERRNIDAIRARGVELALGASLGAFSLDGSLSWTSARVEASGLSAALDGMRPAQTPRLAASASLAWVPLARWRLVLSARHTGAQFEDDLETDVLDAATTFNAFVLVPLNDRLALVLRAENLTDARVVTRNQAGSIDLGAPRTFWAGLRLNIGE